MSKQHIIDLITIVAFCCRAPHSSVHLCTAGDDHQVCAFAVLDGSLCLIWLSLANYLVFQFFQSSASHTASPTSLSQVRIYCMCSAGSHLGYLGDPAGDRGPDPGVHSCRPDQPATLVRGPVRLDCHWLRHFARDPPRLISCSRAHNIALIHMYKIIVYKLFLLCYSYSIYCTMH